MHEMGIAMEVIRIVRESIPADMIDPRVERIHMKIGTLSLIVADSLRFCFEVATRQTDLEQATLVIEPVPARARCGQCTHQWTIESPVFVCPVCQSGHIEVLSGRELDIDSIEIATDEDSADADPGT